MANNNYYSAIEFGIRWRDGRSRACGIWRRDMHLSLRGSREWERCRYFPASMNKVWSGGRLRMLGCVSTTSKYEN